MYVSWRFCCGVTVCSVARDHAAEYCGYYLKGHDSSNEADQAAWQKGQPVAVMRWHSRKPNLWHQLRKRNCVWQQQAGMYSMQDRRRRNVSTKAAVLKWNWVSYNSSVGQRDGDDSYGWWHCVHFTSFENTSTSNKVASRSFYLVFLCFPSSQHLSAATSNSAHVWAISGASTHRKPSRTRSWGGVSSFAGTRWWTR